MPDIPPEACIAAVSAAVDGWPPSGGKALRDYVQAILEAAAPHIAAAERRRIAAASFSPDDSERLGLFRLAAADGALAERERLLASLPDALGRLEVRVPLSGPMARKVVAEDFAAALIEAITGERP